MVFILGITGGIGCGKTAATDHFKHHGVEVIDADDIAKLVVTAGSPALKKITEHFGDSLLLSNGELDREALRHRIFDEPEEKQWLEELLHPLIRREIQVQLQKAKTPYVILSAPLLLEKGLNKLTNRVLVIDCDEETQLTRASSRDYNVGSNNIDIIKKIMKQQLSRSERLAKADDVISNQGTIEDLYKAVDYYHQSLIKEIA